MKTNRLTLIGDQMDFITRSVRGEIENDEREEKSLCCDAPIMEENFCGACGEHCK